MQETRGDITAVARALRCDAVWLLADTPPRRLRMRRVWPSPSEDSAPAQGPWPAFLSTASAHRPALMPPVHPAARSEWMGILLDRTDSGSHALAFASSTGFDATDAAIADMVLPVLITVAAQWEPAHVAPVLTPRENHILLLVADGLTAEAVARRCGISRRTVHKHLEQMYRKIGCNDRVTAVRYATRLGLLHP